jgi:hypothetical protein
LRWVRNGLVKRNLKFYYEEGRADNFEIVDAIWTFIMANAENKIPGVAFCNDVHKEVE